MSKIIVSADYFGKELRTTKQHNNISTEQLKHLLGCSTNQLNDYIYGSALIPSDVLRHIFKYAVMMDEMINKE